MIKGSFKEDYHFGYKLFKGFIWSKIKSNGGAAADGQLEEI